MTLAIDGDRIGTDIALPLGEGATLRTTATGDLRTVAGYENLQGASVRRALTIPGSLLHRPDYGGGLPLFIEKAGDPTRRGQLRNMVRRDQLTDPRVADCKVAVTEGVVGEAGQVVTKRGATCEIKLKVADDEDWLSATAAAAE